LEAQRQVDFSWKKLMEGRESDYFENIVFSRTRLVSIDTKVVEEF
jgi:hypothetical protein